MAEGLTAPRPQDTDAAAIIWPSQDAATLLATALTHWTQVEAAETTWRRKAEDDKRFVAGEQWHEAVAQQRHEDRRPCLVIDRMGTHLRQIVNEGRQTRPGILVSPVDNQADPETAKILRGLVRDIEQQSNADIAYTTSRENAVQIGRGFVRVLPVYPDPYSFRQELRICAVRNPFSVYLDPTHQEPDGSDANWAFIVTRLAKDVYEQTYGRLPLAAQQWMAEGDRWISEAEVQVAEYWWREWHPMTLALWQGQPMPLSQVPEAARTADLKTRTVRVPEVWQAKLNGHEVLEQTKWLGRYLPLAQEVGELMDVNGEVDYRGATRRLKDPQRQVNYWESAKSEMIALAPKSPVIGAAEQFEGLEGYWVSANTRNWPYLPYNPVAVHGALLPPPQRSSVEPPVQAMVQGSAMAADDIKAISGYQDQVPEDAARGISGEAIRRRQQSTNTACYHFQDNERWMIRHLGRILVDAIPHYYDEPQTVRIVGDDDQVRQVRLNERYTDEDGQDVLYDVTVGRYDVRIDGGPSFATKRQDTVDKLGPILSAAPQLLGIIGDDYFQSLDVDLAHHMAERIRKTMPPQLLEGEPGAAKSRQAAEQMQQLEQLPKLVEQLKAQQAQVLSMQQALDSLRFDNQALRLELQNKTGQLQLQEVKLRIEAEEKAHQARMQQRELDVQWFEAQTDRLKVAQNGRPREDTEADEVG